MSQAMAVSTHSPERRKGSSLSWKPGKAEPLAEKKGRNSRDAILAAALRSFAREGYDGASMPRIARLAQVAPPLIHYHFGAKDNLWRETIEYSLGQLKHETSMIFEATRGLEPMSRLRALLQTHARFAVRQPDQFFMIMAEARANPERFEWVRTHYTGLLFEEVVILLEQARQAGAIRDLRLDTIATVLISSILVNFTVYPREGAGEAIEADAMAFCDTLFDLLQHGIASTAR